MMNVRTRPAAAIAVILLVTVLGACGDSDGPITYYQAVCSQMHGIVRGWEGPRRKTLAAAMRDAQAHKKFYPGHTVTIEEGH